MSTADEDVSLTPEEVRAVTELAGRYEDKRAASIEALKLVQRRRRWVSNGRLGEVARLLDMTPDELDSVATFYNLIFRRPVGRHVILLCDSVSCWILGQEELLAHCARRLGLVPGATTPDGRFTLLPTVCLGHCDHAPALMIGDDLHGDVDPARLDALLEEYR
ncbi:MAG TPA: NADH-quinone oxidoreductase subunit NuoE [Stellaceae bacterium]|nr:NADH-quinone oxidoreductase subunit NuoE [Stellaceae bacterium]